MGRILSFCFVLPTPHVINISSLDTVDRLGRIRKRSIEKCHVWYKIAGINF